jgi:hypothetical protein
MRDWTEEMQKCIDSPYYFYTNFCVVDGKLPETRYTEEEFNNMIKQGITIKQIEDGRDT